MLESGFSQNPLSWLTPSLGMVDALAPMDVAPPNLQEQTCGKHRKRPAAEDEDMDADSDNSQPAAAAANETRSLLLSALRAPTNPVLLSDLGPVMPSWSIPARRARRRSSPRFPPTLPPTPTTLKRKPSTKRRRHAPRRSGGTREAGK